MKVKGYRVTKIPNFLEFIKVACPVCGHAGGCMIHTSGDRVVCIRVESDIPFSKNSSLPSWLHFLGKKRQPRIDAKNIDHIQGNKKLPDSELNYIFSIMLDYLELTDEHYNHLTSPSRGLNDEEIMIRGYSSFPSAPWSLAKAIQNDYGIESFAGVPGFFEAKGKYGNYWTISRIMEGILIPYRNYKNEITGFQYRIDNPPPVAKIKQLTGVYGLKAENKGNHVQVFHEGELVFEKEMELNETASIMDSNNKSLGFVSLKKGNRYYWLSSANKPNGTGAGSPSPIHVAVPTKILKDWKSGQPLHRKTVWLTEGALKADIASDMLQRAFTPEQLATHGDTFLAVPGVNAWQTIMPVLEKMGVQEINLAFDRDFTDNALVMSSLKEFMAECKKKGYHINLVSWGKDDGKGIDDLLLTRTKIPKITKIF